MSYSIGDRVQMKKQHPCGGNEWEILRVGADFRLKCKTCNHMIMLARPKFEKGVKKIIHSSN